MKKTLIAIAALAAAMVGCTQFGEDSIKASDAIEGRVYYGYIQDETRTILDTDNHINWEAGDQLSVFENGEAFNLKYDVVLADGETTSKNATFKYTEEWTGSAEPELAANYAIFPYSEENSAAGNVLSFPMPEVVNGAVDGNIDHLPMVATTPFNSEDFWFSSPVSLFRVRVSKENNYPNTVKLLSLTLTSRSGQPLWGTASVDMSASPYVATVTNDSETKNSVTVNFGEGVTIDFVNKHFYIAIPAMTFEENDLQLTYVVQVGKVVKDPVVINKVPSLVMPAGTVKQTSIKINAESFTGSTDDAGPVANVNGIEYTTLEAAFKAAIELGGEQSISVVSDALVKEAITVPASSTINLILNGNNVTSELEGVTITNNGKLSIVGGTITTKTHGIKMNTTGASLTVGAGAAIVSKEGAAAYVPADVDAAITVLGSVESQGVYGAIQTNGTSGTTIITIEEGAKVTSAGGTALYCPGAVLTVNGGEISGYSAIYHKKGSLTINGGTFTATGAYNAYSYNGSGSNDTGDAVVVEWCAKDTAYGAVANVVEINGGTFIATDAASGAKALAVYKHTAELHADNALTVVAGSYNTDPNEYVARGYKAFEDAAGMWVVGENFEASIGSEKYVTLAEAFKAAAKGNTITLLRDATLTEGITVVDNSVLSDITLDGAGKTITLNKVSGAGLRFGSHSVSAWATGVKIKDLTIKGEATYALYLCGGTSSTIDNLTVEGTYDNGGYGAVILYGTHGATISNSNICSGFSNGGDTYPLHLVNTKWGELFINASEVDADAKLFVDENSSIDKVVCGSYKSNMVDSESLARITNVYAEYQKKGSSTSGEFPMVAKLNGVLYANVEDAISDANDGNTVYILEGEHQIAAIKRKDSSVSSLTIEGAGADKTTIYGIESQNNLPDIYAEGLNVTFKNLTFDSVGEYESGIGGAASVTFEKCTILKEFYCQSGADHTFTECTFYPANGYVYTWGSHCVFTDCVFNCANGKALQVYGVEGSAVHNITITDCTFNAEQTGYTHPGTLEGGGKPVTAVDINSVGNGGFNVEINNATLNGPWGVGIYSGYTLFNDKSNNPEKVTVVVDGRTYVASGLWLNNITGEYEIDNAAGLKSFATIVNAQLNDIFDGATVNLMNDINLGGEEWIPIGDYRNSSGTQFGSAAKPSVFNGNNHIISNFKVTQKTSKADSNKSSYGLFANVHADIKDLTVVGANVDLGDATQCGYVGALVGRLNGGSLTNCHVKDSYVEASYWMAGGLVGQMNSTGTISGCSVSNSTVASTSAVGSLVGMICAEGTNVIENSEATNVKVVMVDSSYGDNYKQMFGTLVGALNNGARTTYLNNCTASDVYVKGQLSNIAVGFYGEGDILYIDGKQYITDGVMVAELGQGAYELSNANGMFWFANEVNVNRNGFGGKTVKMVDDIDLENKAWIPIGQTGSGTTYFQGTFDGQNNTIYNLNLLNESNLWYSATGLFGFVDAASASFKNIKVDGTKVVGAHWTGVIVGYLTGSIDNCHVSNVEMVSNPNILDTNNEYNGDKTGGIVGYVNTGANSVTNCTVANTTITGYRHIGGIVGYTQGQATITGNKVLDGVTINVDNSNNYKDYSVRADYGVDHIVGVTSGVDITGNQGTATINWNGILANGSGFEASAGGTDIDW